MHLDGQDDGFSFPEIEFPEELRRRRTVPNSPSLEPRGSVKEGWIEPFHLCSTKLFSNGVRDEDSPVDVLEYIKLAHNCEVGKGRSVADNDQIRPTSFRCLRSCRNSSVP